MSTNLSPRAAACSEIVVTVALVIAVLPPAISGHAAPAEAQSSQRGLQRPELQTRTAKTTKNEDGSDTTSASAHR